jgi:hypothetical protein
VREGITTGGMILLETNKSTIYKSNNQIGSKDESITPTITTADS